MAMASSVSSEKVLTNINEQILLCAICIERFKSPKILPCLHTYCEPCLTEWVKTNDDQLICPTCKESFPLPSGGVPAIANNRFMNDLQQILGDVNSGSQKSVCAVCKKETKFWCQDCGEFFCDECVNTHKTMRLLKDHELMTLDEYTEKMSSENSRLIQPRFCDKHPSAQLELYCDSCQIPTCVKCTLVEHTPPEHKTLSVEAALEKYMPTMKEYEEKAAQKVSDLKQARDGVLDVGKCLEKNKTTAESQIKDLSKIVVDETKEQENRLLAKVAGTYSPKRKQIDSKVEQLEHRLVGAESIHSHLNHLLRYGGAVDIMAAKNEICQRLGQDGLTEENFDSIDSDLGFTENPRCRLVDLGYIYQVNASSRCDLLDKDKAVKAIVANSSSYSENVNESCFSEVSAKFHLNHVQLTEKEAQYVLEEVANETGVGGTCNSDGSVVVRGSLVQIAMVEERLRLMKEAKTSMQREMASSGQSANISKFQNSTIDNKRKVTAENFKKQEDAISNPTDKFAQSAGNEVVCNLDQNKDETRVDETEMAAGLGYEVIIDPSDKCQKQNVKQGDKAVGPKDKVATEKIEEEGNGQDIVRKQDEILKKTNKQVIPEENCKTRCESDNVEEKSNLGIISASHKNENKLKESEGNKTARRKIKLRSTQDHDSQKDAENSKTKAEGSKDAPLESKQSGQPTSGEIPPHGKVKPTVLNRENQIQQFKAGKSERDHLEDIEAKESKPSGQPTSGILDNDEIPHHNGKVQHTMHDSEKLIQLSKAGKSESDQLEEAREFKPSRQPTSGELDNDEIPPHGKVKPTVQNRENQIQQSKAGKRERDRLKDARYGPEVRVAKGDNNMKFNDVKEMRETAILKKPLKSTAMSKIEKKHASKCSGETIVVEDSHILVYMEMIHCDEIFDITQLFKVDIQWKQGTQKIHFIKASSDCTEGYLERAVRKYSKLVDRVKANLKYCIVDVNSCREMLSDTMWQTAKQKLKKYNEKVIMLDEEKYKFKLLSEDDEALRKSLKECYDFLGVKKSPKLCSYIEVPEEATGGNEVCSSAKHESGQSKARAYQEKLDVEHDTMQVSLESNMLDFIFDAKEHALNDLRQRYDVHFKREKDFLLEISSNKAWRKGKKERVESTDNVVDLVQPLHTKLTSIDVNFKDEAAVKNMTINAAKKHTKIVHKNVYIRDISPTCIRIYGEGDSAKLASETLCRCLGLPVPGSRHGKGNKTDTGTSASSGVHSYQRQHSGSNSTDAIGSTLFEFTSSTGTKVSIKYGDITKEKVDAIVNPANDKLKHSGGVAAAIVNAGGYSIQGESDKITDKRTLNVGEVVCTKAGSLPCKAVLHVVGPYWKPYDADTVTAYLYDCCWNLLMQASNWDYKSVAIPAIGTGIHRVPKPVCAQMMFNAVKVFTDQQVYNDRLRRIIFIDIDWDTVKTFEDIFRRSSSVQRTQDREPSNHGMGSTSADPPSTMHMQVASPTTHPLSQPGMTQSATYNATLSASQSESVNKHHYSQEKPQNQVKGRASSGASHGGDDDNDNKCPICLDNMKKPQALPCKHKFCKKCKEEAEKKIGPTCPVCKEAYDIITGNMPKGTMSHRVERFSLSGYSQYGTIVISYYFKHGIQGKEHPNPGKPYRGTSRTAYLPDNIEGREVLRLLKIAFDRRLTFTIGDSGTTSASQTVTWNDIHHKTSMSGGPLNYGYPDPDYLKRVKEELADKGVK